MCASCRTIPSAASRPLTPGAFGYQLDITRLSDEDKQKVIFYNQEYHRYNDLLREGTYYRIASYRENNMYDCWQVVSEDKSECLVTYVQVRYQPFWNPRRLKLEGLDPDARYRLEGTDQVYSGGLLMYAGYLQNMIFGDYGSAMLHFVKERQNGRRGRGASASCALRLPGPSFFCMSSSSGTFIRQFPRCVLLLYSSYPSASCHARIGPSYSGLILVLL